MSDLEATLQKLRDNPPYPGPGDCLNNDGSLRWRPTSYGGHRLKTACGIHFVTADTPSGFRLKVRFNGNHVFQYTYGLGYRAPAEADRDVLHALGMVGLLSARDLNILRAGLSKETWTSHQRFSKTEPSSAPGLTMAPNSP